MLISSRNRKRLVMLLPFTLLIIALLVIGLHTKPNEPAASKQRETQAVFYVDDVNGKDSNNGLSENTPLLTLLKVNSMTFMPGDKILLKANGSWHGQLSPKGSGSAEHPIILDYYGQGHKPIINGDGVDSAIYLYNQQYWELRNIEVTNDADKPGNRTGIHIVGKNYGTLHYFRLKNLVVHHIKGNNDFSAMGKATGGIMFDIPEYDTVQTKFSDVIIEDCTIYKADRTGIYAFSGWWRASDHFRSEGLLIRNNSIYDIGGDGLIVIGFDKSVIEYNVLHDCNSRSGSYAVGMFPFGSDDTIIQYNEVYLTRTTQDGQGFDIDFNTKRTIIQYNYSHDNEGGFLLVCVPGSEKEAYNKDSIVRYNISQNDGRAVFNLGGPVENVQIYNNTVYVGPDVITNLYAITDWNGGYASHVYSTNNLFYDLGESQYYLGEGKDIVFDHNSFYGNHSDSEPKDLHKINADPKLVKPGIGGIGRSLTDGYKLEMSSPCKDAGIVIRNNGGKDYWGNALNMKTASIGAFEF